MDMVFDETGALNAASIPNWASIAKQAIRMTRLAVQMAPKGR